MQTAYAEAKLSLPVLARTAWTSCQCRVPPADPRSGSLEPTSPRSVEACLRLGVEPSELRHVPMEWFLHVEHGDHELADIAYKHCETIRTVRLAAVASMNSWAGLMQLAAAGQTVQSAAAEHAQACRGHSGGSCVEAAGASHHK